MNKFQNGCYINKLTYCGVAYIFLTFPGLGSDLLGINSLFSLSVHFDRAVEIYRNLLLYSILCFLTGKHKLNISQRKIIKRRKTFIKCNQRMSMISIQFSELVL